nr:MAG TPA: hypothetical protein [Bacteriophage sp.]
MPQTQKSPDIERCFVQYPGLSLIQTLQRLTLFV